MNPSLTRLLRQALGRLTWPATIVLFAGLIATVYGPFLSEAVAAKRIRSDNNSKTDESGRTLSSFVLFSVIAGILVAVLTALQIQCMIVGGCHVAAWSFSLIAFAATIFYMYVITRISLGWATALNKSSAANRSMGNDVNNNVSPQLAANPLYGIVMSVREELLRVDKP
jgi:hypothetical protein